MSKFFSIVIMSVNYSHDIATAFLAVGAVALWIISSHFPDKERGDDESEKFLVLIYKKISRLAEFALAWILIAGIPRIVYYTRFEWSNLAGDLQIVAIIVKHVVMFALVGTGIFYWVRLNRKVRALKIKHNLI